MAGMQSSFLGGGANSGGDRVNFSCTALVGTNKVGNLKRDADGYYEVVLGALDVFNHAGQFWPMQSAKQIFQESSSFMRRISRAALRAEYGHPKRIPGQPLGEYADRLTKIYETQVCCHIRKVWIESNRVKDDSGRVVIAIMGLVKPAGPFASSLEASFQNPHENVCFSIRSVTNDVVIRGRYEKNIKEIITWDYVNEPGIAHANKYSIPSLESIDSDIVATEELEELVVPTELLAQYVANQRAMGMSMSMEDSDGVSLENLLQRLEIDKPKVANYGRPGSTRW